MAYDGYRAQSPYEQSSYNPDYTQPPSYQPPYPLHHDLEPDRSRFPPSPSNPIPEPYPEPSRYQMPPQAPPPQPPPPPQAQHPLNDAVTSAVNRADGTSYLSPEVLSQITATVIQQLKSAGFDGAQQQQAPPPPPLANAQPVPEPSHPSDYSPSAASRTLYTPPSPYKSSDEQRYPSPQPTHYPPVQSSPSATPGPGKSSTPPTKPSEHSNWEPRPKPVPRMSSSPEETTLEKIWGPLFDKEQKPTHRLSQFLRGIAVHLIEDYEPGNTIVITPEKMQRFYKDTHVSTDTYPWHDIFDDRTSSISRLFREVEAEHHLTQEKLNERPDIPGLTPRGFDRWATLMILANPEQEYKRLQKAVLDMPISNPDDKKERFPKEIPNRLFPKTADYEVAQRLERAIITHCGVDIPRTVPPEPQPATQTHRHHRTTSKLDPMTASTTESLSSSIERERKPYANSEPLNSNVERERKPYSNPPPPAVEDGEDDEEATPVRPIERERKPYSAHPGGGKIYEESASKNGQTETSSAPKTKPGPSGMNGPGSTTTPISTTGHHKSQSHSEATPPDFTYLRSPTSKPPPPISRAGRNRSPSVGIGRDYRHSETDLYGQNGSLGGKYPGFPPPPAGAAGPAYPLSGDIIEDKRYRDFDRDYDLRDKDRGRIRDRSKYDFPSSRTWDTDEDYYRLSDDRGLLGGKGASSGGYDYPSWTGGGYR